MECFLNSSVQAGSYTNTTEHLLDRYPSQPLYSEDEFQAEVKAFEVWLPNLLTIQS